MLELSLRVRGSGTLILGGVEWLLEVLLGLVGEVGKVEDCRGAGCREPQLLGCWWCNCSEGMAERELNDEGRRPSCSCCRSVLLQTGDGNKTAGCRGGWRMVATAHV